MRHLVLSLFPGIGLLDMAFEEAGFCVVRGPDVLWGGDIRTFKAPYHRFDGIIGGPPCQMFSALKRLNPLAGEKQGNLIPEFERVIREADPTWFLMENVPQAPDPAPGTHIVRTILLNNRDVDRGDGFGPEQHRLRKFCFGTKTGMHLHVEQCVFSAPSFETAVTSAHARVPVAIGGSGKRKKTKPVTVLSGHGPVGRGRGYEENISIAEACILQGVPPDFLDDAPFTAHGKRKVIGNGVPLFLGRAIAKAVLEAINSAREVA